MGNMLKVAVQQTITAVGLQGTLDEKPLLPVRLYYCSNDHSQSPSDLYISNMGWSIYNCLPDLQKHHTHTTASARSRPNPLTSRSCTSYTSISHIYCLKSPPHSGLTPSLGCLFSYFFLYIIDFRRVLPSNLSGNEFKEIPPAIFAHDKLTNLSLANNLLKNITLTSAQAAFLGKLKDFHFDESNISKNCSEAERKKVGSLSFCIVEVASGSTSGSGAKSSSSLPMLLGIVGGALVVIIAVFVIRTQKLKRAKDAYTFGDGTMPTLTETDGTSTLSL